MSKEFAINRKNLTEIKRLKEQVKELKAEAPTLASKEKAPTEAQPAPAAEAAAAPAAPAKPKKKRVAGGTAEGNAIRYKKRVDLNDTESKFLSEWFYKKGFGGRDVLYKQIQKHYTDSDTPPKERISRRRLWIWLAKQEVNQLHRALPATSESIKPINSMGKLDRCQVDLVIRGGDQLRTWKGWLTCIDVATRYTWTEALKSTKSKAVASAFETILKRVAESIPDKDKKTAEGKSKTWAVVQSDNGSEFKDEFATLLAKLNMTQLKGVPNVSTSQSLVERVQGTLSNSMEKDTTATGANWYDILSKHTGFYNEKTNRNLRLQPEGDDEGDYVYYTPKELWQGDRLTLTRLYDAKSVELKKGNRLFGKESEVKIGQKVRIARLDKRKAALSKGATQSWSKSVYVIYKIQRPKNVLSSLPIRFFVKSDETGDIRKDPNGTPIRYVLKNLQLIDADVQTAPKANVVVDTNTIGTRSTRKAAEAAAAAAELEAEADAQPEPLAKKTATPTPTPPTKAKAPAAVDDPLIGQSVTGKFDSYTERELKVKGEIVKRQKRKKAWWYQVKWGKAHQDKYDYTELSWFRKTKIQQMLVQN
jgi:hypothetical protein